MFGSLDNASPPCTHILRAKETTKDQSGRQLLDIYNRFSNVLVPLRQAVLEASAMWGSQYPVLILSYYGAVTISSHIAKVVLTKSDLFIAHKVSQS